MKKKILICLLVVSIILLGATVAVLITSLNRSGKEKSDNKVVIDPNAKYKSSEGGEALDAADPDFVGINPGTFDINTVVATDAVGRTLGTDGSGDNGRQVALFYNINHFGNEGTRMFEDTLARGGTFATGKSYWWGKPFFGFYKSDDSWVLRKHIEMFIYAGIDFLVFDTTNGQAYTDYALQLMSLLHEYNEMGWHAPQVVFYTNTDALGTMMQAYLDVYEPNKYPDTWYMVDGKPLIIGNGESPLIKEFFTVRHAQWPNAENVPGGFPWIDFKDVAEVQYDEDGKHGVIPVSVAQNCSPNAWFSDNVLYGMTGETGGSRGRSWHDGKDNITEDSYKYGYNFQEEWETAIASDAEIAMVLQWNEWRAGVWPTGGKLAIFDEMTREYSRDIEPMEEGHFDNYYMQLVYNVRRFKSTGGRTAAAKEKTIDVSGAFGQWNGVDNVYIDMMNAAGHRDGDSFGKERYVDDSGRNCMVCAKAAADSSNLYFYVQTQADVSSDTSGTWMNLYLDIDGDLRNSWNGYELRVCGVASDGKLRLEKYNGSSFEPAAEIAYRMRGNQLMLAVPRSAAGLPEGRIAVNFKWADSAVAFESVEDFYRFGDTMPYGRFNYAFTAGN